MPQVEVICYNCNDRVTIPVEQFNRFMEEYNYCEIENCQNTEMCPECSNQCDKCIGIYCTDHFHGVKRLCIDCDPEKENDD